MCLQGDLGERGFLGPPGIEGAKVRTRDSGKAAVVGLCFSK